MNYLDIPIDQRHYVRESAYVLMSEGERRLYLKHVRRLVFELDELAESSSNDTVESTDVISLEVRGRVYPDESITNARADLIRRSPPGIVHHNTHKIKFVGMKSRGGHRFSAKDIVHLEKDDDNLCNPNAIKVLLCKSGGKWVHVANVCQYNTKFLRRIVGFDELPLRFVSNNGRTSSYLIDLEPLVKCHEVSVIKHILKTSHKVTVEDTDTSSDEYSDSSSDGEFTRLEMCMNDPF
ncbi:hypothetical protein BGZ90_001797 [Linnemannia elongata]|nr:hypothetical protein BGZ90_001797 [Linnemannia elongata]